MIVLRRELSRVISHFLGEKRQLHSLAGRARTATFCRRELTVSRVADSTSLTFQYRYCKFTITHLVQIFITGAELYVITQFSLPRKSNYERKTLHVPSVKYLEFVIMLHGRVKRDGGDKSFRKTFFGMLGRDWFVLHHHPLASTFIHTPTLDHFMFISLLVHKRVTLVSC